MAKKKTINDEENGAIRKAIPAKSEKKAGKKTSIKSASVQSVNEVADVEIKKIIDTVNTDIVVDNKKPKQAPKDKKLPTNKKGYTPRVKVAKAANSHTDNSDSQIIPDASESKMPLNSTPPAEIPTGDNNVQNSKHTENKSELSVELTPELKNIDVLKNEPESKPAKKLIKLTTLRSNKATEEPKQANEPISNRSDSGELSQNNQRTKAKQIKLQLRKSNALEVHNTEIAKDNSTVKPEEMSNNEKATQQPAPNIAEAAKPANDETPINNGTPSDSAFEQALSNEALRRKQYWANRKKNKKLAIAAAAERRALALAQASENAKNEEISAEINNLIDTPKVNSPANAKVSSPANAKVNSPANAKVNSPANAKVNAPENAKVSSPANAKVNAPANAKVNTNSNHNKRKQPNEIAAKPLEVKPIDNNNADIISDINTAAVEQEAKLIGKNAAKNRKNKKNKKLRKLANSEQISSDTQIAPENDVIAKKANLLKFVITKDKIAKLDGVQIPEPKLPIKPNKEKQEILHTRTNVQIAKNKIVLAKGPKRISDAEERKPLPIINIKQVIQAKPTLEIGKQLPNDIEKKKSIANLLSEIQKEPKSKLKVKIILSDKKTSLNSAQLQAEREDKFQNKKKKKKNQVNKYAAEALASKDEIIELPPEDYIKMTFPDKSEYKHEAEDTAPIRGTGFTEINPNRRINYLSKASPLVQKMISSVKHNLVEEFYSFSNARYLLAVSGGVDSIVMLDIMAQLAEELKMTIAVAHFNHNLRGLSSNNDEELVRKVCLSYGIRFYTSSENIIKYASDNSISIEQAARHRRYKMFERLSGNLKIDFVSTAHTADDSVETFFLNLLRGTGLTGLSGIPRKRHLVKNTYIIRPIMDFKKSEIYQYAKERNLQWREDETNTLTNYTRNKIRLDLLPKIQQDFSPAIFDLINRTSRLIRGADQFINEFVEGAAETMIKDRRKDRFYINIAQLDTYSEFIQGEVIRACLSNVFKLLPPNIKVIDRVLSLVNSPSGAIADINKQIYALKDRGVIIFAQRTAIDSVNMLIDRTCEINLEFATLKLTAIDRKSVEFTKDPFVEFLDADLLPAKLQLRNWEQGDEFKPLGMDGTMKISDFLINQKIPSVEKRGVLVLSTKSEIIWVVGKRLCNTFKVTGNTQKVIKAELILTKEKGK